MAKITIQAATPDLFEKIIAASRETHRAHNATMPFVFGEDGFEVGLGRFYEVFFDKLKNQPASGGLGNVFVALLGNKFVGYITFSDYSNLGGELDNVTISDIYCEPEFRGNGVGKALLVHLKEVCLEQGWTNLRAEVWGSNEPSARLFESCGFARISQQFRFGPNKELKVNQRAPIQSWRQRIWAKAKIFFCGFGMLAFAFLLLFVAMLALR